MKVSIEHLTSFCSKLVQKLREQPSLVIPAMEKATQQVYAIHYQETISGRFSKLPTFQVQISSDERPRMLRDMVSNMMGSLLFIPGIITAASKASIKATVVYGLWSEWPHLRLHVRQGLLGGRAHCVRLEGPCDGRIPTRGRRHGPG